MKKKKTKIYYSYKKFMKACKKVKGPIEHQLVYKGPDAERISKEVDNELS